tara:strand:+ start:7523 stop:7735 length:213 start_codon:yes stop_codon:yes gene_type:complete
MSNKNQPSFLTKIRRFFAAIFLIVIGGETALLYRIYDAHGVEGILSPESIGQENTTPNPEPVDQEIETLR